MRGPCKAHVKLEGEVPTERDLSCAVLRRPSRGEAQWVNPSQLKERGANPCGAMLQILRTWAAMSSQTLHMRACADRVRLTGLAARRDGWLGRRFE